MTALRGAGWQVPVLSFIDENCVVFDDADENQVCASRLPGVPCLILSRSCKRRLPLQR